MSKTPRRVVVALAAALACGALVAAADVLSQFQLTEEEAQSKAFDAIWGGSAPDLYGAAGIFRKLSPDARATAVTALAAVVRAYAESDAFRERYALQRRADRPTEIKGTGAKPADVDKQMSESDKAMAQAQEAMKNMPPEMRKMMEAMMKENGAGDVDIDAAMAEGRKSMKEGAAQQKEAIAKTNAAAAKSQQSAKAFDENYPANPERLLARRLREFLDLTASVPDGAVLVPRGGKMVFADPVLEKKPDLWKQLYRAGKPARDAARAAAERWLAALERGA